MLEARDGIEESNGTQSHTNTSIQDTDMRVEQDERRYKDGTWVTPPWTREGTLSRCSPEE